MSLLDRTHQRRTRRAEIPRSDLTGAQLLEAATAAYTHAEQEFDRSPETREELAVRASVHDNTFAKVMGLHVCLEGDTTLVFAVPPLSTERAVVLFEFYRRDETRKVRAVGQGYDDGLAGLARDFGVSVT